MTRDLVVYGAGGMGQEVVDIVRSAGEDHRSFADVGDPWRLIGFVDDNRSLHRHQVVGLPVLGGLEWLRSHRATVAVGIGSPVSRRRAALALRQAGLAAAPPLIHPSASIGERAELGEGTVIGAQAALTTDVVIGGFVIVNIGATVSHQCQLGDFATVAPGAHLAGAVRLEEGSDVGIGASIVQGRTVGRWSVVGAGAVVVHDVLPGTTVIGCPARPIRTRPEGWTP